MKGKSRKGARCRASWTEGQVCWMGVWAKGLCAMHYNQERNGSAFTAPRSEASTCTASWPGGKCGDLAATFRGLCGRHMSQDVACIDFRRPRTHDFDGKRVFAKVSDEHVSAMSEYAKASGCRLPDVVREAIEMWVSSRGGVAK